MRAERRHPPNYLQIAALLISAGMLLLSACGLVIGPVFGAGVAVIGVYVTSQSHSAVTDEKLQSIKVSVDKLVDQNEIRQKSDGKTEQLLQEYDRRITDAKGIADQALARATNATIEAKSKK